MGLNQAVRTGRILPGPVGMLLAVLSGACAPGGGSGPDTAAPGGLPAHEAESSRVTRRELDLMEEWAGRLTAGSRSEDAWVDGWLQTSSPFSFKFGEEDSSSLLGRWESTRDEPQSAAGQVIREIAWQDPSTGLRVTWSVKRFLDFPALEWVLWFENTGSETTPALKDIEALDLSLKSPQDGQPYIVHGVLGGRSRFDDLAPFSQTLLPAGSGATRFMELGTVPAAIRDRSESTNNHLPFFNVETPDDRGLLIGIGWSGRWRARLNVAQGELRVRGGLQETNLVLRPGEKIRSPRILAALWEGKRLHGQNLFRRLLYEHYVPSLRGRPHEPLVAVNTAFTYKGFGTFLHQATEEKILALVDPFVRLGAELFIIDAGWFGQSPWHRWLGNWTIARDKFPRGFVPISERLAEAGVEFGLWFGPEMVTGEAPVVERHPELLRPDSGDRRFTVRMELPEAREWFLEQLDRLVGEQGVTCYRQDLSGGFPEDPEDRVGISESQHVAGLYELWDELKRRHPGLIMEGCCAGGRRIDLETLTRFHWHQKSDRWYDSESDQLGLYGASLFLPGGLINVPTQATDDYGAWSGFAGQFSMGWDVLDEGFPREQARRQVELYKQIRPLLSGDFYPLTPPSFDQPWIGYQFHRRDLDQGMALVFRRGRIKPLTPVPDQLTVGLRGLDPDRAYRVRLRTAGSEDVRTGLSLAGAVRITIPEAPGAEMITYQRAD